MRFCGNLNPTTPKERDDFSDISESLDWRYFRREEAWLSLGRKKQVLRLEKKLLVLLPKVRYRK